MNEIDVFISKIDGLQESSKRVFELTDEDSFGVYVDAVQRLDIRMLDDTNNIKKTILASMECFEAAIFLQPEVESALKLGVRTILMGLMMAGIEGMKAKQETVILQAVVEQKTASNTSSATARKAAKARHAPINQQKSKALAEWYKTHDQYSSMSAFAQYRHKEFGVKARTVIDWIRKDRISVEDKTTQSHNVPVLPIIQEV